MKRNLLMLLMSVLPFTAAPLFAFDAETVNIHGFISQGYLISDQNDYFFADTEDGTFEFNEIGINFTIQPTDQLRVGAQLISRDLGRFGDNEVKLDWAFGDYRYRNWLGVRAGLLKLALGLYNQSRDIDFVRTAIFLPPSIYAESRRETQESILGVGIYGDLPGRIHYQVQAGKLDIDADSGVSEELSLEIGVPTAFFEVETDDRTYGVHLDWEPPLDGLRLAGTFIDEVNWDTRTPGPTFRTEAYTWILSAEYIRGNLLLAGEYRQQPIEIFVDGQSISAFTEEQFYVMANYRFTDGFEAGSYYSVFFEDTDDRDGDDSAAAGQPRELAWFKDWAVTARFDINPSWIVKLEGHFFDGLLTMAASDPDAEDTGFLFAVKTTFSF